MGIDFAGRWPIARNRKFGVLFWTIFLVSGGALISISVFLHRSGGHHRLAMVRNEETHAVEMRQDAVVEIIEATVSDLLFLSELNELGPFLASDGQSSRDALSAELAAFSRRQGRYDQIRVLAQEGMEILRVDFYEGMPLLVPEKALQFKGDRSYFRELSRCAPGAIYVSPLDLNVEGDEIELPPRPMLHLGLALAVDGATRGYLLVNLRGSVVLDAFDRAHPEPESTALLVTEAGHWLRGPSPDTEWGFILPDRTDERFQRLFPSEWDAVSSAVDGQFETANGLFSFSTLVPYMEADALRCAMIGTAPDIAATGDPEPLHWKNVSWVAADSLARTWNAGAAQLASWNVIGVLILGSGSWGFARWMTRRAELHRKTELEKELLQSTLRKYMPQDIRSRLLADPARHARLGGESQDVAVLFADIRGFTRFAEHHDPNEVVAVLNRTLTELTAPLRVYGGILDKYAGDGFLAFFEPSTDLSDAAQRSVDAARVMQRAFRNLWADAPTEALRELGLGIGIGAGRVIVGNVGSEDAMDYTVVGDAVNVASRLQDLAEAGEILVSQSTHELIRDEDDAEMMPLTRLRGRREPMNVYKLRSDAGSATT